MYLKIEFDSVLHAMSDDGTPLYEMVNVSISGSFEIGGDLKVIEAILTNALEGIQSLEATGPAS